MLCRIRIQFLLSVKHNVHFRSNTLCGYTDQWSSQNLPGLEVSVLCGYLLYDSLLHGVPAVQTANILQNPPNPFRLQLPEEFLIRRKHPALFVPGFEEKCRCGRAKDIRAGDAVFSAQKYGPD